MSQQESDDGLGPWWAWVLIGCIFGPIVAEQYGTLWAIVAFIVCVSLFPLGFYIQRRLARGR